MPIALLITLLAASIPAPEAAAPPPAVVQPAAPDPAPALGGSLFTGFS